MVVASSASMLAKGVVALVADQTKVEQGLKRIARRGHVATQFSAGCEADSQLLYDGGVMQATLFQIVQLRHYGVAATDRRQELA